MSNIDIKKKKEEYLKNKHEAKVSNKTHHGFYIKSNFFGGDTKGSYVRPKPYGWIIFSIVIGFVLALASIILYWVYENIQSQIGQKIAGQTSKYTETDLKNIKYYSSLALLIVHCVWALLVLIAVVNMLLKKSAYKNTKNPYNPTSMVVLGFIILILILCGIWANAVNLNFKVVDGNKDLFEYFMLIFRFCFPFIAAVLSGFTLGAYGKARKNRAI